jgi:hypothetical protein
MNNQTLDPSRIISILEILLAQLDASLSPQVTEGDTRTDLLKKRIDGFKDQTGRLKSILKKHQDAERRKRMLDKQNRKNTKLPKIG